ncbi:MAG: WbuC family cupin fold metalloprotein [Methylobacter sp.]
MITPINQQLLKNLSKEAIESPRRRKNHNFHQNNEAQAHRLLNAIELSSYVMPHKHNDPNKAETMICLTGKLGLIVFDSTGNVQQTLVLEANSETVGVDIPHGVFHTVLALESGTVFFEAKAGPFVPITAEEKAPWAPAEGDELVSNYLATLYALFD